MNATTLNDLDAPRDEALEQARFNMVEQQIRPWDVLDTRVLDLLSQVRRENFVPPTLRAMSFVDMEIPLRVGGVDTGETMLAPKLEARLLQELALKSTDSVLEIGAGSGYQAALMASQANQVTTVEIDSRLAAFAQENLQRQGITNVRVETGDGRSGWGTTEYEAILVSGSVPEVPDGLKYQLRVGGRMLVIVGQAPVMTAWLITRTTAASFDSISLFETVVKPLRGTSVSKFKF
ncbi:protein-L-isoaspartate O-methyltransferase [Pigmentiphaga aceris]|uniref:Protein-L-isoaspartate O-methyltransferase n=1 Tax=Pigmentiphaga aceris TaxID=1940612 RepID=A0A5C0B667_9BURK|nr:protein-L-isoaspartate O-methyltransferase [Pigmentiphaga aceris]QEI08371.1 protein-L-isoaspartate O-methyltransferase [Pigmentiphaga aceris]